MSNCVDVFNVVSFSSKDFRDFENFKRVVREANTLRDVYSDDVKDDDSFDQYISWWFLKPDFRDDAFLWHVGDHRSTHTWRDLKQTMMVLRRHMKKDFMVTLSCRDENWSEYRNVNLLAKDGNQVVEVCSVKRGV